MAGQEASSIPPSASLISLPPEIVTQIVLFLDRQTACSLARCCRLLADHATRRIWRNIDLTVNPNYGGYPLIQPHPKLMDNGEANLDHWEWAYAETEAVEERHDAGVKAEMEGLLGRSGHQGWGWIRTVNFITVPSAIPAIAEVLAKVAPTLREMDMEDPDRPATGLPDPAQADEALGHRILSQGIRITFPSLTSIRLGDGCLRFLEWLVLLCSSAPELIDLDVSLAYVGAYHYPGDAKATRPIFPSIVAHTTKIQRLRLSCRDDELVDRSGRPLSAMRSLITHSPALRLASFNYDEPYNVGTRLLIDSLRSQLRLQDLHWYAGEVGFRMEVDEAHRRTGEAGFPSLKRLVFSDCRGFDVFTHIPSIPSLEIIYLNTVPTDDVVYPAVDFNSTRTFSHAMPSCLAERLRSCPRLHTIASAPSPAIDIDLDYFHRLDLMEHQFDIGTVASFQHNGCELVCLWLLTRYSVQELGQSADFGAPVSDIQLIASALDGSHHLLEFESVDQASWQVYTDLGGMAVPLEIMDEMSAVQGVEEWEGRGIEASDDAWRVVVEWRERVLANPPRVGHGPDPL